MFGLFFKQNSKLECHNVLLTTNTYYKNLSKENKKNFRIRTLIFLETTNFNSDPEFHLDKSMKIIISSAFVQITFGLKINTLNIFNNIFITPRSYSYKNNTAIFDGDVNLYTKKINMSWPAIENGFKIPDDAINLSIHEFGHCLIFENTKRSYLSKIFKEKSFNQWKKQAEYKFQKIKLNKNKVLRDYAGTNLMELFSVSLETFFEKPEFFEKNEPILYLSMVKLFKQDPRNKLNPIIK
ncbi:zinc-dependent peptidase [Lutibacter sp. A80]|nr:zinc-dependent peptidase [Lutibacter sp. A80]UMB62206.1 zinc-dependent peptidase [Lutibacter sp. A80]